MKNAGKWVLGILVLMYLASGDDDEPEKPRYVPPAPVKKTVASPIAPVAPVAKSAPTSAAVAAPPPPPPDPQLLALEKRLQDFGVFPGTPDGFWDDGVTKALREFERRNPPPEIGVGRAKAAPAEAVSLPPPGAAQPPVPAPAQTAAVPPTPGGDNIPSGTPAVGTWSQMVSKCDRPSLRITPSSIEVNGTACTVTDVKTQGGQVAYTAECIRNGAKEPFALRVTVKNKTMVWEGGPGSGKFFRCS